MNLETELKIAKGLIFFSFIALFFCLGFGFGSGQISFGKIIKSDNPSNCTNLSFQGTVHCLNTDFNQWFKYNLNQSGKTLSEAELKTSGGVCSHASKWYVDKTKSLGYAGEFISFYGKNITEYCIVDQTDIIGCASLDSNGGTGHAIALLYKDE